MRHLVLIVGLWAAALLHSMRKTAVQRSRKLSRARKTAACDCGWL